MTNRATIFSLKRAIEACGSADKLAKAADTLRGFGVTINDKQVERKLESMAYDEMRIAEIAIQLDDLDFFYVDIETSHSQDDLQRMRLRK
jgi:DNA polymerase III sliding clamp (beta) subunit (PCNA family)